MDNLLLESERTKKFNNWGEREPIVCADSQKILTALADATRADLSDDEKSARYVHVLTGCQGFEFIAYSNAKIDRPTYLANSVILFPCFLDTNGLDVRDPKVEASLRMRQTARYVYDGWIPIISMTDDCSDPMILDTKIMRFRGYLKCQLVEHATVLQIRLA